MIFSNIFILKFIFLIFLIFLSIYLFYIEFMYTDKLNLLNGTVVKESGNKFTMGLEKIFLVIIPAGIGYRTYFRDEYRLANLNKQLKENNETIKTLTADNEELKGQQAEALRISREVINYSSELITNNNKLITLKKKESELQSAIKSLNAFSGEKITKLSEKEGLDKEIQGVETKLEQNIDKIEEIKNKISKQSIISFDFELQSFLDSLRKEELLAFSGLLLNSLVLSHVVSIILVLYGDYLIKRFDLEHKYPKLAKFIEVRRKLQNYYLKICFVWIFIGIIPQICVYGYILFPKFLALFS